MFLPKKKNLHVLRLVNFLIIQEAEMIKSIPLSSRLPEDKLIWALSPNGQFSVRSAYSLAVSLSHAVDRGASSDAGLVRRFWKKVWSLPVPHKTRHFA